MKDFRLNDFQIKILEETLKIEIDKKSIKYLFEDNFLMYIKINSIEFESFKVGMYHHKNDFEEIKKILFEKVEYVKRYGCSKNIL